MIRLEPGAHLMSNPKAEANEKVMQLLKPPVLSYIRELGRIVDQDPNYLTFHSGSVVLRVKSLLSQYQPERSWNESDRQVIGVVKEAIVRLRSFEK